LQVVSVTAADNNLDLTVGNRRAIRTSCRNERDTRNAAQGAIVWGEAAAPVGEGAAAHA
jgi:hypothetical protein